MVARRTNAVIERMQAALDTSSGIEREVVDQADRLEILPGLTANVATIGHLLALKVLARDDRTRPQDADDIRALLAEASDNDVDEARKALALIEVRVGARPTAAAAARGDPRRSGSPSLRTPLPGSS